jgi:hypothetical protein
MITVSPVPLWSTFRAQDVLVANSYSKAVLRAAVESFCADRQHVSYFPSYEFAMLSNPRAVWRRDDYRHVDPVFVDFLVASVLEQFDGGANASGRSARQAAQARLLRQAVLGDHCSRAGGVGAIGAALQGGWARLKKAWSQMKRGSGQASAAPRALGHLDRWDGLSLSGWGFVANEPGPAEVTVWADGVCIARMVADLPRPDVAAVHGESRNHCGFHVALDVHRLGGEVLSVRVGAQLLKTLPLDTSAKQAARRSTG